MRNAAAHLKCNAEDDEIILVKIITIIIIMMTIIIMIMMMTTVMIMMISIMVIIGQECPLPAGGQMGSVWKWRLLMNTGTAATLWHRHRHCCYTLELQCTKCMSAT